MPQEKPKKKKKQAPRPDEREPTQYPSETMRGIKETGLYQDTLRPVLGPSDIKTPPFVPSGRSTFQRGRNFDTDSLHLYNVQSEPAQHVNTLAHELAHSGLNRGQGFDLAYGDNEQDAAHTGYALQYIRLLNEGVSPEHAMETVRVYSRGKVKMVDEWVLSAADWWRENIPTAEQLESNDPHMDTGQWDDIKAATRSASGGERENLIQEVPQEASGRSIRDRLEQTPEGKLVGRLAEYLGRSSGEKGRAEHDPAWYDRDHPEFFEKRVAQDAKFDQEHDWSTEKPWMRDWVKQRNYEMNQEPLTRQIGQQSHRATMERNYGEPSASTVPIPEGELIYREREVGKTPAARQDATSVRRPTITRVKIR